MRWMTGLLVLVLAGCVDTPLLGGAGDLARTSWVLTELNGRALVSTPDVPTLEFGGDEAGGNSGCNFFGGPYDQDGGALRFGALASTRRACGDSAGSAQETAYFVALDATTRAATSGGTLVLYAGDRALARFRAAED